MHLIKLQRLSAHALLPTYATPGSAGADLYSAESVNIKPGSTVVLTTGWLIELPLDCPLAWVTPRSGLAARYGLTIPNSPGLIDCDYRGELKVVLQLPCNALIDHLHINVGMRIAQLSIPPYTQCKFIETTINSDTQRGRKGFGHSGE